MSVITRLCTKSPSSLVPPHVRKVDLQPGSGSFQSTKVAKEYAAYLLHDFYDDRETVLALL
jgi:hypothetical protein